MNKETGGPAFSRAGNEWEDMAWVEAPAQKGMTLRDYFAAEAMAAVMPAVMNELKKTRGSIKEAQRLNSLSAESCYQMADAMLKARNGKN